jgi:hypothetical protein
MSGDTPFHVGDRVRHVNAHAYTTEAKGTVLEVKGPYGDGSWEILVQKDEGYSADDRNEPSWWPSRYTVRGGGAATIL